MERMTPEVSLTRSARRPRAFRIVVAVAATVLALALAEAALRLALGARFVPGPVGQRPQDVLGRWDADLGWSLVTGRATRVFGAGVDYEVTLNSRGFRGPAHDETPAAGRRRIALLGDSTGFGWGVDDDATFAARLERDASLASDVVNLCVPGYSTDQELWTLEREAARVRPDLVLLQFSPNDVEGNDTTFAHRMVKPRFVLGPQGAWRIDNRPAASFVPVGVEPVTWDERTFSRSALWQVISGRVPLLAPTRGPAIDAVAGGAARFTRERFGPDTATRHAFTLLVARCRDLGVPFAAFAVPPLGEPDAPGANDGFLYLPGRLLAELGRDAGFPVISLDAAFHDAWRAGRSVTVPDGHWNAEGHRIAADSLAPRLRELLDRRR